MTGILPKDSSPYGSLLYQNQQVKRKLGESATQTKVTVFHDLLLKMTSHHFFHIILKVISKPTLKGRVLHMGMNKKKQGSLGPILEAGELELQKDA